MILIPSLPSLAVPYGPNWSSFTYMYIFTHITLDVTSYPEVTGWCPSHSHYAPGLRTSQAPIDALLVLLSSAQALLQLLQATPHAVAVFLHLARLGG